MCTTSCVEGYQYTSVLAFYAPLACIYLIGVSILLYIWLSICVCLYIYTYIYSKQDKNEMMSWSSNFYCYYYKEFFFFETLSPSSAVQY